MRERKRGRLSIQPCSLLQMPRDRKRREGEGGGGEGGGVEKEGEGGEGGERERFQELIRIERPWQLLAACQVAGLLDSRFHKSPASCLDEVLYSGFRSLKKIADKSISLK